jgi:hypothetical protein
MSKQQIIKNTVIWILMLTAVIVVSCHKVLSESGWVTKWKGKTGMIADMPGGAVLVGGGNDVNGQATIHINDTLYENTECRIIAIENWGRIHMGIQNSKLVPEKKYRSTEAVFPGITLKDIKEFRFQTRPNKQD